MSSSGSTGSGHSAICPCLNRADAISIVYSAAVIHAHESKNFPGGIIASLSIPWGFDRGDDDLGGYHLVWPRDLVEAAGGLLAAGEGFHLVRRVFHYLQSTQEADGRWPQNMWVDGDLYWQGVQMDEIALPILLAGLIRREGKALHYDPSQLWNTMRHAAAKLVQIGPPRRRTAGRRTAVTLRSRWPRKSPPCWPPLIWRTPTAPAAASYLRETADAWNACIESWLYVTDTELARRVGVDGYYLRIVEAGKAAASASPDKGGVTIKNRPPADARKAAVDVVSVDALALVRFGLRAADDPRIVNTVKVIDAELKVETPFGPCWRRYSHDGYGEHEDGAAL